MSADDSTLIEDGYCFACGQLSQAGLRLRFTHAPDAGPHAVVARTELRPEFQGWKGVAHGGIVMTLLDEAMAHAAGMQGHLGVTADFTMRFREPVPLEAPLVVSGDVEWARGKVLALRSQIADLDGRILATASGRFVSRGAVKPGTLGRLPSTSQS